MFAVRQRYRGQSGVEQVFVLRVFSLLHASQHALAGAADAGEEASEDRPLNMNSMTGRSARLTAFRYMIRTFLLYTTGGKNNTHFIDYPSIWDMGDRERRSDLLWSIWPAGFERTAWR